MVPPTLRGGFHDEISDGRARLARAAPLLRSPPFGPAGGPRARPRPARQQLQPSSANYHQVMQPHFLNVDLEIWSASKLNSLAAEMGKRVWVLHCGPAPKRHLLAVEISRWRKDPDSAIHALCAVVESLTPSSRRTWNAARKEFDVGYELRTAERSSHFTLRPDTLARVSSLGASLAVTYYRGEPDEA